MSGAAPSLQRYRGMLAQGMRLLCGVWALALLDYAPTTGLDAHVALTALEGSQDSSQSQELPSLQQDRTSVSAPWMICTS